MEEIFIEKKNHWTTEGEEEWWWNLVAKTVSATIRQTYNH